MQTKNQSINVFYATNDKQASLALISMISVLENTKNNVSITILHNKLSKQYVNAFNSLQKYQNCSLNFCNIDEKNIESFPLTRWVTIEAWYRTKIPDLFPEIEKAIYLDCDTLLNGDIAEFWEIDIQDYLVAGVRDIWNFESNSKRLDMQNDLYINSGILLINCTKWREENIFSKMTDYIQQSADKISCADQDVINKITDGKKLGLKQRYNYLETWWHNYYHQYKNNEIATYEEAKQNPLIIHFTAYKPNTIKSKHSYKDLWWSYAKKSVLYEKFLEDYKVQADELYNKNS